MTLSELYLYPLKSCAPLPLHDATVEPRGLSGDRRWMIVDGDRRFITGRQFPRITLIRAVPDARGLALSAPGMPELRVEAPNAPAATVEIWKQHVPAIVASGDATAWLSRYLGTDARLVYMDDTIRRPVDPACSREGDIVSYADSCPLMLIGRASLDGLNRRLDAPVGMTRFRPNLVVDTDLAHVEDGWARITIGEVEFDVAKACTRCNFVNVDPVAGERSANGQPLKTLTTYRRFGDGVNFGVHLIPRSAGVLRRGDRMSVLQTR
ncbi:MAG TPA: MOSC N-terminal beta barrel domain-containing protein [Lysobacter sp.]